MTRQCGRRHRRLWGWMCAVTAVALCAVVPFEHADAAGKRKPARKPNLSHVSKQSLPDEAVVAPPLSYSEEFDRAELIERMLNECRGISYNALELAQTSGEALWLPAPTQLVVVRVRHPYCGELLRTYAPKTSV